MILILVCFFERFSFRDKTRIVKHDTKFSPVIISSKKSDIFVIEYKKTMKLHAVHMM